MKGLPLAGLLCLGWAVSSQATVTIQNCGGAISEFHSNCSLQEPIDDGNGDGAPEIAALAQSVNSGSYVVEVRNLGSPALSVTRSLHAGHRPSAITALADPNGNGIPELAVLQTDLGTGVTRVEVRDELGAANPRLYSFAGGAAARPLAFLGLPDTDGDSVPEFAVLFDQELTAATNVVINDADGPGNARTVPFTRGHRVETFGMALLGDADGNGSQEVALLQSGGVFRGDISPLSVEIRNVAGPATPRYFGFFRF